MRLPTLYPLALALALCGTAAFAALPSTLALSEARDAVAEGRRLAAAGDLKAIVHLAYRYDEGIGVAADPKQAAMLYLVAALEGDVTAQNNLALMYLEGRGVPQDDAQAAQWLQRAAASGDVEAIVNLGVLYGEGRGVPRDAREAARLFRLAAERGDPRARDYLQALSPR